MSKKNRKPEKQNDTISYLDILYMTPSKLSAKDLADFLKKEAGIIVDLWEEMNVLEIELPNRDTVSFEPLDTSFKDASDAAFVKNRGIQTIFALQMNEEDLPVMKQYFDHIINNFKGFFCADTEDFLPVYAGSSTRH